LYVLKTKFGIKIYRIYSEVEKTCPVLA
jgi:hypothetical protein